MVNFVCGPQWFLNTDIIIEIIALVIALLIGIYSNKAYKFTQERKYFFFAAAFYLIAFSFLIKIFASWLSCSGFKEVVLGHVTVVQYNMDKIQFIYNLGSFFHRFFMLSALIILIILCLRIRTKKEMLLLFFFVFVSTLFSTQTYFMFHLIATFLLLYISLYFYANYYRKRTKNSFIVALSFALLFVSQLIFIFVLINPKVYVIGEIIQVIGYLCLLLTYLLIGKK